MKNKLKLLTILGAIALTITSLGSCTTNSDPIINEPIYNIKEGDAYKFCALISQYSQKYDIDLLDLLKSNELLGNEQVTNSLLARLLYTAFPNLREPYGFRSERFNGFNEKHINYNTFDKTDVQIAKYFLSRGILSAQDVYMLDEDNYYAYSTNPPTLNSCYLILKRIESYKGDVAENNYYSFINNEELFDTSDSNNLNYYLNNESSKDFLYEKIGYFSDFSSIKNINDFYSTLFNDEQKTIDLSGTKQYIDTIVASSSFMDLITFMYDFFNQTGISIFGTFETGFYSNQYDTYEISFKNEFMPINGKSSDYIDGSEEYENALNNMISDLSYLGIDYYSLKRICEGYLDFKYDYFRILELLKDPDQSKDEYSKSPNYIFSSQFNLSRLFGLLGIEYNNVYFKDRVRFSAFTTALNLNENAVKYILLKQIRDNYYLCFNDNIRSLSSFNGLNDDNLKNDKNVFYNEVAPFIENEFLSIYKNSEEYLNAYYSIYNCFNIAKDCVLSLLKSNSWLSEETKTKIVKKITSLKAYILVGDEYNLFNPTSVNYLSTEEGGNLFYNISLFNKTKISNTIRYLQRNNPRYLSYYNRLYENSLFYFDNDNVLFINPAYITQFDDLNAFGFEELVARVCWPIAKEIFNALEGDGLFFDENGSYNQSWINNNDLLVLIEKISKLSTFYSTFEEVSLNKVNSNLKISEIYTDFEGMRAIMKGMSSYIDFDYSTFFSYFAKSLLRTFTADQYNDEKSRFNFVLGEARVNALLMNIEEFQELYDLSINDMMYLDETKCIKIR